MTEARAFSQFGAAPDPGPGRGVLAILSDADGRVLLHLRDDKPTIPHPGLWSFFGGAVEAGETLNSAIVRELEEELGVVIGPDVLTPFVWLQSDSPRKTRIHIYCAALDVAPDAITLGEGAGFGFFTKAQALALPLPDILKPVLNAYFEKIAESSTEPPSGGVS